jgi:hypothetical protein
MDVSGDQEQDRIHLRDLLTCCARSQVSPVRGSESSGVFRSRKYQKEGLGTSFHCNSETRHSKNFASLPQAYPSTPKPSSTSPTAHGMQKPILLSSEPPQRSRPRRRAWSPERRRFQPSRPESASSRLQPQDVRAVTTSPALYESDDRMSGFGRPDLLAECLDTVGKCVKETRTISYLLHPPLLDEAGFESAARWYVEGFAERGGIEAKLNFPERMDRLPKSVELALFRILQESLTNVHRHSGSPTVEIEVRGRCRNGNSGYLGPSKFGRRVLVSHRALEQFVRGAPSDCNVP